MRRSCLLLLGGLALMVGLCPCCLWVAHPRPRFDQKFDIGGGRTVCVWSALRDWDDFDPDPNPPVVYYRIGRNGTELVHKTRLGLDDGGEYRFEVLRAEGGRLACVYEVNRYVDDPDLAVLYDAESGKSWPRDYDNWHADSVVKKKWRERFERIAREHPGFKVPRNLLE